MRCYSNPHRFYAGVDLHARSMYTHVLDQKGKTVFEKDLCVILATRVRPRREAPPRRRLPADLRRILEGPGISATGGRPRGDV